MGGESNSYVVTSRKLNTQNFRSDPSRVPPVHPAIRAGDRQYTAWLFALKGVFYVFFYVVLFRFASGGTLCITFWHWLCVSPVWFFLEMCVFFRRFREYDPVWQGQSDDDRQRWYCTQKRLLRVWLLQRRFFWDRFADFRFEGNVPVGTRCILKRGKKEDVLRVGSNSDRVGDSLLVAEIKLERSALSAKQIVMTLQLKITNSSKFSPSMTLSVMAIYIHLWGGFINKR